jgi:lysyl oxidase
MMLTGVLVFAGAPAASAHDVLPDLGIARVSDIKVSTPDGARLLRYTTTIVNIGAGAFELHAQRASTSATEMAVTQRIFDNAGGFRDTSTTATAFYSGDGHNHWHIRDLYRTELTLPDGSTVVSEKRGFCFWDNVRYRLALPGAPGSHVYNDEGCGGASSLTASMGLSVGWGDAYPAGLAGQNIDITGLDAGIYRLTVTADDGRWFTESNEANNSTWVDLQIKTKGQPRVLGYGPAA